MVCAIQGSECDATYDVSTGYGFTIFKKVVIVQNYTNRRGYGASESARHQKVAGSIRTRPHENGGLGAVSSLLEA